MFLAGPEPQNDGNIHTFRYLLLKFFIDCLWDDNVLLSLHSNGDNYGPNFREWIIEKYGLAHWHTHYAQAFKDYASEVFCLYSIQLFCLLWTKFTLLKLLIPAASLHCILLLCTLLRAPIIHLIMATLMLMMTLIMKFLMLILHNSQSNHKYFHPWLKDPPQMTC